MVFDISPGIIFDEDEFNTPAYVWDHPEMITWVIPGSYITYSGAITSAYTTPIQSSSPDGVAWPYWMWYPSGGQSLHVGVQFGYGSSWNKLWRFRAKDSLGWHEVFFYVSTTPPPIPEPRVNFKAEPLTGETPLSVQFTDLSTNSPFYWVWNFGDGWALGVQNPIHVYKNAGIYTVSLTARNESGYKTRTKPDYITVTWDVKRFSPLYQMAIGPAP